MSVIQDDSGISRLHNWLEVTGWGNMAALTILSIRQEPVTDLE